MSRKLSLTDLDVNGKRVLMRVDFNVPLDKNGGITDDSRIRAAIPSIKYIIEHGGSVILMSHLGRPKDAPSSELSMNRCAKRLSELLGKAVLMAPDCIGENVQKLAKNIKPGQVLLLENLRFYRAEEHPEEDPLFARKLASMGDIYVNDAFGTAHRAHSSTVEVPRYYSGNAAAGLLMVKEIQFFGEALKNPKRPFYAILGGAKISSKIGVIRALLEKVDVLLIGGGMAYTFFKAQGIPIGNSLHEDAFLQEAKDILEIAKKNHKKLLFPIDNVVADSFSNDANFQTINSEEGIPEGFQGMDIGPKTIKVFSDELQKAATIFWNGPLGVFEFPNFANGTNTIAHTLAKLPKTVTTIVGGGESIAAVQAAGVADKITHISTGGGASLEYIEYGQLPGIEALSDADQDISHKTKSKKAIVI